MQAKNLYPRLKHLLLNIIVLSIAFQSIIKAQDQTPDRPVLPRETKDQLLKLRSKQQFEYRKFKILEMITDILTSKHGFYMDHNLMYLSPVMDEDQSDSAIKSFAPHGHLENWTYFLQKHGDELMAEPNPTTFIKKIQTIFDKLGTSHLFIRSVKSSKISLRTDKSASDVIKSDVDKNRTQTTIGPVLSLYPNRRIAVLKLPNFRDSYQPYCLEELLRHAVDKTDSLVLDLRDNGGGRIFHLDHLKAMLHPDYPGTVAINKRDYDRVIENLKNQGRPISYTNIYQELEAAEKKHSFFSKRIHSLPHYTKPISVITNKNTGSCAEDITLCLRNLKSSKIYGTKTAGALTSSLDISLSSNIKMQVPIDTVISSKGEMIDGIGISPDHPDDGKTDPAVAAMLDLFSDTNKKLAGGEQVASCTNTRVRSTPPLRITCKEIIELNMDRIDSAGRSATLRAVEAGDLMSLKILLQNGADPTHGDINKQSLLHYAVKFIDPAFLKELLADPSFKQAVLRTINLKDKDGYTPIDIARIEEKHKIVEALFSLIDGDIKKEHPNSHQGK